MRNKKELIDKYKKKRTGVIDSIEFHKDGVVFYEESGRSGGGWWVYHCGEVKQSQLELYVLNEFIADLEAL